MTTTQVQPQNLYNFKSTFASKTSGQSHSNLGRDRPLLYLDTVHFYATELFVFCNLNLCNYRTGPNCQGQYRVQINQIFLKN